MEYPVVFTLHTTQKKSKRRKALPELPALSHQLSLVFYKMLIFCFVFFPFRASPAGPEDGTGYPVESC